MDLKASPDLPAYLCYAVVVLAGFVVAVGQVRKRLGGMQGAWVVGRTWLLFFAYTAVPIVLFWVLDRAGAVNDTSLFAAILIGFGYERIINGGSQTVRAPGEASTYWAPFVAYADKVTKIILERGARNDRRLADAIVSEVSRSENAFNLLVALTKDYSANVSDLDEKLKEIDEIPEIGPADKLAKKIRYLYGQLLGVPDVNYILTREKVISRYLYWKNIKHVPQLVGFTLGIFAGLYAVYAVGNFLFPDHDRIATTYYIWRLGKPNSTSTDQFRSRRALVEVIRGKEALTDRTNDEIVYLVQTPDLAMDRVDLLIETLLENRELSDSSLPRKLVQGLRAPSLDARSRIQQVLVFLAAPCDEKIDDVLMRWKPIEKDSPTTLEQKIALWNRYWAESCVTTAKAASVSSVPVQTGSK